MDAGAGRVARLQRRQPKKKKRSTAEHMTTHTRTKQRKAKTTAHSDGSDKEVEEQEEREDPEQQPNHEVSGGRAGGTRRKQTKDKGTRTRRESQRQREARMRLREHKDRWLRQVQGDTNAVADPASSESSEGYQNDEDSPHDDSASPGHRKTSAIIDDEDSEDEENEHGDEESASPSTPTPVTTNPKRKRRRGRETEVKRLMEEAFEGGKKKQLSKKALELEESDALASGWKAIVKPKQGSTDGDTHTVYIGPDGKEYRSLRLVKRLLEQEEREKSKKKKLRIESDSESSTSSDHVSSRKRARTSTTGRKSGTVKKRSNVPRQRTAKRVANGSSSDSEEKADIDKEQGDRDETYVGRETQQDPESPYLPVSKKSEQSVAVNFLEALAAAALEQTEEDGEEESFWRPPQQQQHRTYNNAIPKGESNGRKRTGSNKATAVDLLTKRQSILARCYRALGADHSEAGASALQSDSPGATNSPRSTASASYHRLSGKDNRQESDGDKGLSDEQKVNRVMRALLQQFVDHSRGQTVPAAQAYETITPTRSLPASTSAPPPPPPSLPASALAIPQPSITDASRPVAATRGSTLPAAPPLPHLSYQHHPHHPYQVMTSTSTSPVASLLPKVTSTLPYMTSADLRTPSATTTTTTLPPISSLFGALRPPTMTGHPSSSSSFSSVTAAKSFSPLPIGSTLPPTDQPTPQHHHFAPGGSSSLDHSLSSFRPTQRTEREFQHQK